MGVVCVHAPAYCSVLCRCFPEESGNDLPDLSWSFAPNQDNTSFKGDAHIFELSHPFSLSRLFICVCSSPAFSVAAGNPLQLCYQEGPVCPYKGKLTCGLDTCEFKALIRSAAWLHSNLSLLWKLLLWPSLHAQTHSTPYPSLIPVHVYSRTFLAESIHTPLCQRICSTCHSSQSRKCGVQKQPSTCAPTGSQKVGTRPEGSLCSQMGLGVSGTWPFVNHNTTGEMQIVCRAGYFELCGTLSQTARMLNVTYIQL